MSNSTKNESTETQKQTSDSKTGYQFFTPPKTQEMLNLEGMKFGIDPTIGYRAASAARRVGNQYSSAMAPYSTPSMNARRNASTIGELNQTAGNEFRAGNFDLQKLNLDRAQFLAQATDPKFAAVSQTGTQSGTSTGTSKTTDSAGRTGLQVGLGVLGAL